MAHLNNKRRSYDPEQGAGDEETHELQPNKMTTWSDDDHPTKDALALPPPAPSGPRIRLTPAQYARSIPGRVRTNCTKDCCFGCLKENLKVLLLILAIFAGTGEWGFFFSLVFFM